MSTCYLVLGTPRSGTSLVSGILHTLGINMGDDLMDGDEMNPAGYFQDWEFEELFSDLEFMPLSIPQDHPDRVKLRQIISRNFASKSMWGVKLRLAPLVLDEFLGLGQVKIIVTNRTITKSIASLQRWSEPWDQDPAEVITRSKATIINSVKDKPHLVVDFDDLVNHPVVGTARIASFAGLTLKQSEATAFVQPHLRRYP